MGDESYEWIQLEATTTTNLNKNKIYTYTFTHILSVWIKDKIIIKEFWPEKSNKYDDHIIIINCR